MTVFNAVFRSGGTGGLLVGRSDPRGFARPECLAHRQGDAETPPLRYRQALQVTFPHAGPADGVPVPLASGQASGSRSPTASCLQNGSAYTSVPSSKARRPGVGALGTLGPGFAATPS